VSGNHLCMSMRGIRKQALMHTSVVLGRFLSIPAARAEFLALVANNRTRVSQPD
jgi:GTP cyclohydrolase I